MNRRPRRITPAVVVAVALLVIAVLVAVSLIQHLGNAKELVSYHSIAVHLHDTTWHSYWVLGIGIAAVVLGGVLMLAAVLPGRRVVEPLEDEEGMDAGITRRSLDGALNDTAASVAGLEAARVRRGRRNIRVSGRAAHPDHAELEQTVNAAVGDRLARIGPKSAPPVSTRLRAAQQPGRVDKRVHVRKEVS
ncbi:DUF6286 domain-containing protein [Nocardia africana]|uniref:DUF6286 domain-containing protein n=1 Tax=Nocardia africana TaxID=134964 RepID=A0A378WP43_9NOCA|nr:DUF6286 domain-containing protein [Nocardia africana]MCC3315196.1 DUF6286 domain-containing protein [Nocardia africana]SUA42507.1 Uncharacterised protein [Nocardia africana]